MLKTFMYFTIITFAVVIVWIGLTIYWNFKPVTAPPDEIKVVPIEGNFDFDTINRIKARTPITADFNAIFVSSPSATILNSQPVQTDVDASTEDTIQPTIESISPIATESAQQL